MWCQKTTLWLERISMLEGATVVHADCGNVPLILDQSLSNNLVWRVYLEDKQAHQVTLYS